MRRDRRIQEMLLRQVRDGEEFAELKSLPNEVVCYNAALLIDGGYAEGRAHKDSKGRYAVAALSALTNAGQDLLEEIDNSNSEQAEQSKSHSKIVMTIFISHSSADGAVADALIRLLRSAFSFKQEEIRCTSVDGYRLEVGASTDDRLKEEVRGSKAFIGIITPTSIESAYVLFELGARWGADLSLFPVLAGGADSSMLRGPLAAINGLSLANEAQVHQLLDDLGKEIDVKASSPAAYTSEIKSLVEAAKVVHSMAAAIRNASTVAPLDPRGIRTLYEVDQRTGWAVEKSTGKYFCSRCLLKVPPVESLLIDREGDGGWQCQVSDCRAYLPTPERASRDRYESQMQAESFRRPGRMDGL